MAIEVTYRRMIAGLSHLSRRDRAAALKAAGARRQAGMRALRDKRAAARRIRRVGRLWQAPPPP